MNEQHKPSSDPFEKLQRGLDDIRDRFKKNQNEELRYELRSALEKGGVEPKYLRHAVGLLIDSEKRARIDEKCRFVFRDSFEDVDLSTGVQNWLKSEQARIFLKPEARNVDTAHGGRPTSNLVHKEQLAVKLYEALTGAPITKKLTYEECAVKFHEALTGSSVKLK